MNFPLLPEIDRDSHYVFDNGDRIRPSRLSPGRWVIVLYGQPYVLTINNKKTFASPNEAIGAYHFHLNEEGKKKHPKLGL